MVKKLSLSNPTQAQKRKTILLSTLLLCGAAVICPATMTFAASGTNASPSAAGNVIPKASTGTTFTPVEAQEFRANQAGAQLSQIQQWQRKAQEQALLGQGPQTSASIQNNHQVAKNQEGKTIDFILKDIIFSKSDVLTQSELAAIVAPYKGKLVTLQTLYEIVAAVNKQYQNGGYLTCQAFLPPQRIKDGVVHIDLSEGVNGDITVKGNKNTRTSYITERVAIHKGKIPRLPDMNASILRFNATNDVQLHMTLEPGKKPGTTDYVLTLREPQQSTVGLIADNGGSESSGKIRKGVYWTYRSLTGVRDTLNITAIKSKGNKTASIAYSRPISNIGLIANLNASINRVHIVKGPLEKLHMHGRGDSFSVGLTRPLVTTATRKEDVGVTLAGQRSENDITGGTKWTDDRSRTFDVFYDNIHYGNAYTFYQRYDFELGAARQYKGVNNEGDDYATKRYSKLLGTLMYQRRLAKGDMVNATVSWQLSPTRFLPSGEQFYIGGNFSVRGYSDNVLSGDGGAYGRFEYSTPLTKKNNLAFYTFVDGGQVWGKSAFKSRRLASYGFGIRTAMGAHNSLSLGIGFPVIRVLNGVEQSKQNIVLSYNGTF